MRQEFKKITRKATYISLFLATTLISSCHHPGIPQMDTRIKLPNPDYRLYISDATGSSYLYKVLFVFKFGEGGYPDAINDLWKKSKIPPEERYHYMLANVTYYRGVDWSVLLFEEQYYSVVGDIVRIVCPPESSTLSSHAAE